MSQENVEIVRLIHEGWAKGDFGIGKEFLTSDYEWHQFPQAVEPGTRRGSEVGESLRKIFEIYTDVRVEPAEFIDAGDRIVVIGRTHATARGSGLALDTPIALVWTLLDGKISRTEAFSDRDQALEAAGLSE
jgi:uncharacterized protein